MKVQGPGSKVQVGKYPRYPELMKMRMERMASLGIGARSPGLLAFECKLVLQAYYGSYFRAGCQLIREAALHNLVSTYWRLVFWVSDKAGWTKLVPLRPGEKFIKTRHGSKCAYLNCQDMECIEKSVPGWFKKLTGWHAES